MIIQVDTREKERAIKKIIEYFDAQGIKHFSSKLYVGDYSNLENPLIIVDRKQNLGELAGNVCQEHKRFRDELIRARDNGVKLVILCEHGGGIKELEDVIFWKNPRSVERKKVNGKWVDIPTKAITGERLYKILNTLRIKYGVDFQFCDKRETGKRIVEILNDDS